MYAEQVRFGFLFQFLNDFFVGKLMRPDRTAQYLLGIFLHLAELADQDPGVGRDYCADFFRRRRILVRFIFSFF